MLVYLSLLSSYPASLLFLLSRGPPLVRLLFEQPGPHARETERRVQSHDIPYNYQGLTSYGPLGLRYREGIHGVQIAPSTQANQETLGVSLLPSFEFDSVTR